jgi:hypothetical protein
MFNNTNILITGGTGSFGRQYAKTLLERYTPNKIIIFSRDELKHFEMQQEFPQDCMRFFIGGVRDLEFDSVDVRMNGSKPCVWEKTQKVHPESPRITGCRSLRNCEITINWIIPTHDDITYQKYLELVWHRFLNQVEEKNSELSRDKRSDC